MMPPKRSQEVIGEADAITLAAAEVKGMKKHVLVLSLVSILGLCSLTPAGATTAERGIPVILSTDVGNEIDDKWAIVYTRLSPEFHVLEAMPAHAPRIAPPAGKTGAAILRDIIERRLAMWNHGRFSKGPVIR